MSHPPPQARMLGRVRPAWCPWCRAVPGPDCPTRGSDQRQRRRVERAAVRRYVNNMNNMEDSDE